MTNNSSRIIREVLCLKMQQDEMLKTKLKALCSAVAAGLESGKPEPFNVESLISEAKGRAGLDA